MAISEPILAFTLNRLHAKSTSDLASPPATEEELNRRLQDKAAAGEIARVAGQGKGPTETHFQYAGVPAESVAEITKLVFRIRATHKRHLEAVYEIGADLLRAKELLGHGNFLPWLQSEFRWSERTANNYMSIARFFQGKAANFADLDIGAAAALAARSTPAEVRDAFLKRAEAGEIITRQEVRERLAVSREVRRTTEVVSADAAPPVSAPAGDGGERLAPGPAIVERLNAEEVMLTAAMRPLLPAPLPGAFEPGRAAAGTDGRKLIEAMLEMERFVALLPTDAPVQAAALLAAQSESELARVRKLIGVILHVRQALDDKTAARGEPEMLRAS
jgi:hypothetical protein